MLSRSQRIPRSDFQIIQRKSRRFHGKLLSFSCSIDKKTEEKPRFAVVVSKKVAKNAVDRNRLRRRAYATLSREFKNINKPLDGIFIYQKGSANASFDDIYQEIISLLKKAKVYGA